MLKISDGGAGLLTAIDEKGKERLYVRPADTAEGTLVEIQRPGSGESGWLITDKEQSYGVRSRLRRGSGQFSYRLSPAIEFSSESEYLSMLYYRRNLGFGKNRIERVEAAN